MTRTEPRTTPTLPPIALTPEQAAAVAVALAAQPEGPYAADGRAALEVVLAALEPDPLRRAALVARTRQVQAAARARSPHPTHPAGRALRSAAAPIAPAGPRLVLLPGGRQG